MGIFIKKYNEDKVREEEHKFWYFSEDIKKNKKQNKQNNIEKFKKVKANVKFRGDKLLVALIFIVGNILFGIIYYNITTFIVSCLPL